MVLLLAALGTGAFVGAQLLAGGRVRDGVATAWLASLVLAAAGGTAMRRRRREVPDTGALAAAGLVADYEDQLHEVRAGLAGVATAVHVLTSPEAMLNGVRRSRIEGMLEHEVHRLQRLLAPALEPTYAVVALDDVVGLAVTARQLAGQQVHWQPSGLAVVAAADHVTEVLTTLLTNAACHAPGSPVWVEARVDGDDVRLQVTDAGPGVPRELRDAVFVRGTCGPDSTGEGIGLHVARTLVQEVGGSLELAPATGGGATFVLTLPAAPMSGQVLPRQRTTVDSAALQVVA